MNTNKTNITQLDLLQQARPFLEYVQEWLDHLPALIVAEAMPEPERAAIVSVDILAGFCTIGPLASPRVNAIVAPTTRLMQTTWAQGLRHILLLQDTHEPDAVEFGAWPPHCVRGTAEAETVAEIMALPFYGQMITMPKNSIDSGANTGLNQWMAEHPWVNTYFVVGDCTDLCVYQLAMHLRTDANARQLQRRVIVPADCVDTYHRSVEDARAQGGFPHPGDFLHAVFLYHMALNGVEVVRAVEG